MMSLLSNPVLVVKVRPLTSKGIANFKDNKKLTIIFFIRILLVIRTFCG